MINFLNETVFINDDLWNIIFEVYESLQIAKEIGAFYRCMDINRIYIKEKRVIIDALDFLTIPGERISNEDYADLNYFVDELKGNKLAIIPPEISTHKSANLSTVVWMLGCIAFFIFEVF